MKTFLKEHYIVLIAFLLPFLFIAALLVTVYLPSRSVTTTYDFLYATCPSGQDMYWCQRYAQKMYSVSKDGKLVKNPLPANIDNNYNDIPDKDEVYDVKFFVHDPDGDASQGVTFEEASAYTLSQTLSSPDGVTVDRHYDRGFSVFPIIDGNYQSGYVLKKGRVTRDLHLVGDDSYYGNEVYLIGWVLSR